MKKHYIVKVMGNEFNEVWILQDVIRGFDTIEMTYTYKYQFTSSYDLALKIEDKEEAERLANMVNGEVILRDKPLLVDFSLGG
ncbi:hypothetical protein EUA50_06515 [Staphylococcus saprophyticus]|uniref:hypothetical protein n=1 Tax=Staphylococcus saprophyticus TaxID=29385 RepID=UPI001010A14C|nr:hypothetical protein [Staphylococcus saprophyticus]RXS10118.1 hypothetical protein EUA50_06515 [Staphylococcus saprophyticus]